VLALGISGLVERMRRPPIKEELPYIGKRKDVLLEPDW